MGVYHWTGLLWKLIRTLITGLDARGLFFFFLPLQNMTFSHKIRIIRSNIFEKRWVKYSERGIFTIELIEPFIFWWTLCLRRKGYLIFFPQPSISQHDCSTEHRMGNVVLHHLGFATMIHDDTSGMCLSLCWRKNYFKPWGNIMKSPAIQILTLQWSELFYNHVKFQGSSLIRGLLYAQDLKSVT